MKKLSVVLVLILLLSIISPFAYGQEVINSATGEGYGGSGSIDSDAAWLTGGTAFRIFAVPFDRDTDQTVLARPQDRYRYLPFALYLFPDGFSPQPVHYNMHISYDGQSIVRSTVPAFDVRTPAFTEAFRVAYEESIGTPHERKSPDNLFVKRWLEITVNGKGYLNIDWSAESHPDLVRRFFFTDENPLFGEWAAWFEDWEDANRALVNDYIAAISFAYLYLGYSGQYTLPSSIYQDDNSLKTIGYRELYQELVALFNTTDNTGNWSLVFEPIADFYPSGNISARAWTSASEIAQVLAEKAYRTDQTLYTLASEYLWGLEKPIRPDAGHYTRYQAGLAYALQNTSVYSDFIFSQTRAIFTNNFARGSYQPDQYLLADSLMPELHNETGYLGGWGIVYIKDVLPPLEDRTISAMKYAVFVDHSDDLTIYRNLGSFTGMDLVPEIHYSKDSVAKAVYFTAANEMATMTDFLSFPNLSDTIPNYMATREIVLKNAYLPASFGQEALPLIPNAFPSSSFAREATPVGADVIGTAKYAVKSGCILSMIDEATALVLDRIRDTSADNAAAVGITEAQLREAITSPTSDQLIGPGSRMTARDVASGFRSAPSNLEGVPVTLDETALMSTDGQPLVELSGNIPIIYALSTAVDRPQAVVLQLILSPDQVTALPADPPQEFDEGSEYCIQLTPPTQLVEDALVIGWKTDKASVDTSALGNDLLQHIEAALPSLSPGASISTLIDLEDLKTSYSADYIAIRNTDATVCGAATETSSGALDGFTAVIVYLETPNQDQDLEVVEIISADAYPEYSTGIATVIVRNNGATSQESPLAFSAGETSQSVPVSLEPGAEAAIEFSFSAGTRDNTLNLCAEINPERTHPSSESDWSNNQKCTSPTVIGPTITVDGPCVTWTEVKLQNEPIQRCYSVGRPPMIICYWVDNWVSYTLTYEACIDGELEIESDPNGLFPNLKASVGGNPLKAGYGFELKVHAQVTPVERQFKGATGGGRGWTGSTIPDRKIAAPSFSAIELPWVITPRPHLEISQANYIVLDFASAGNQSLSSVFIAPISSASQMGKRQIYTDIDLAGDRANPRDYSFKVLVSATWPDAGDETISIILYDSIRIFGSMYEDDRTW